MDPRPFEYVAPPTIDDALVALAERPGAKILAGGHSLLPLMKMRLASPELVVDIGGLPDLDSVRDEDDSIVVGPLVTHARAATSELIREHCAALAEAAATVGDVQVRARGTVGGSVVHADAIGDEPGAVLALAAEMEVRSVRGMRTIPSDEFFVDTLTSALGADEILTAIRIPKHQGSHGSAYVKVGRRGGARDYPVAGAAAWVRREGGRVTAARLAITGAASKPSVAVAAGAALVSTSGDESACRAAAGLATDSLTILGDLYGSKEYKAHLAGVCARKALSTAVKRAE